MSKLGRKVLHSQTREVVSEVLKFMTKEALIGKFLIDEKKIIERVSKATGVSERSVRRIKLESKMHDESNAETPGSCSFTTPKRKRKSKPVTNMDSFDQEVIRRTIFYYYLQDKSLPTLNKILQKLKETINFRGSKTSLRTIIRNMGFRWKKTKSNRSVLVEQHHIQQRRFEFLQKIAKFRAENRPIVYMDESYIHSTHTVNKGWSTKEKSANPPVPVSKGSRIIIIHAGGEMGFVPNCLTMWKSTSSTGDFHNEMNSTNFTKWLKDKCIPNLPPRSVLVLDNAPYHNIQIDKPPTSNSTKSQMIAWLTGKGIHVEDNMLKVQLYEKVKENIGYRHKKYVIDEILKQNNHDVLRLPPYHPELNPIETIWGEVKNWIAANNVTFTADDVLRLAQQKFDSVTAEVWQPKCRKVKDVEQEYREIQGRVETSVESLIIELGVEDSEDSSESSDNSSSDDDDENEMSGVEELV